LDAGSIMKKLTCGWGYTEINVEPHKACVVTWWIKMDSCCSSASGLDDNGSHKKTPESSNTILG